MLLARAAPVDRVFEQFRGEFLGKSSPSHFFWGSFDLAVTRFSGAPADVVGHRLERERAHHARVVLARGQQRRLLARRRRVAVHRLQVRRAPATWVSRRIRRAREAAYNQRMGEFILPYDALRTASAPDAMLREFLETTYAAAANLGHWDRVLLVQQPRASATWLQQGWSNHVERKTELYAP